MMGTKIIASVTLLLLTSVATAGSDQTGIVKDVADSSSTGAVLVSLDGPLNGKANCSAGHYWVIKDEKSKSGKKQREALMKAQAEKLNVTILGMGNCSRLSDGEDIDSIVVANVTKDDTRGIGGKSASPLLPPPPGK